MRPQWPDGATSATCSTGDLDARILLDNESMVSVRQAAVLLVRSSNDYRPEPSCLDYQGTADNWVRSGCQ
jgi:hypothetical protein